jgi:hypothetical protein
MDLNVLSQVKIPYQIPINVVMSLTIP